jgi:RNA polymerase sigma-70 factor (ECF subfamily)
MAAPGAGYAAKHDVRPSAGAMMHAEDLELARRASAREPEALRRFAERAACVPAYLRHRAARAGFRLTPAVLDDVTQDTYLAVWRKLSSYRGESRLETWVCGFAFHQLRKHWEGCARRGGRALDEANEPGSPAKPPDEARELVERALERLGPPAEDVIRLKHYEELTFESIGLRLGLSTNTTKSHYYRGLARLRGWLGRRGEELVG